MSNIATFLIYGERSLDAGNYAAAESFYRMVLDIEPNNVHGLHALAKIAHEVGAVDTSTRLIKRAQKLDRSKNASQLLKTLRDGPKRRGSPKSNPSFLLIREWGCGLWSDISSTMGGLLLAEGTGRIPVIHWGEGSLYRDAGAEGFSQFFRPVSPFTIDHELLRDSSERYPEKWQGTKLGMRRSANGVGDGYRVSPIHLLQRNERIVVSDYYTGIKDVLFWLPEAHPLFGKPIGEVFRYLLQKYFHPQPHITAAVKEFIGNQFAGREFVAAHIRGTDKLGEQVDLDQVNTAIIDHLRSLDPNLPIFLMTDDRRWSKLAKNIFGSRVVMTDAARVEGNAALHQVRPLPGKQLGFEMLVDTYIASHADQFVGNGMSNPAAAIAEMKEWSPGKCKLLSSSILQQTHPNLFL